MGLLEIFKGRRAPVPPRCFACTQSVIPLEPIAGGRWWCAVCAKDFAATLEDDATWRVDLTPVRHRRRWTVCPAYTWLTLSRQPDFQIYCK